MPTRLIAERVKALRGRLGWTGQRLAEEMTNVGVGWDRSVVANLEAGRRRFVTIDELFALALVLQVAPVHLLVPPGMADKDPIAVTPTLPMPAYLVRRWIRGSATIGDQDPRLVFSEVPIDELSPPDVLEHVAREMGHSPSGSPDGS